MRGRPERPGDPRGRDVEGRAVLFRGDDEVRVVPAGVEVGRLRLVLAGPDGAGAPCRGQERDGVTAVQPDAVALGVAAQPRGEVVRAEPAGERLIVSGRLRPGDAIAERDEVAARDR